MSKTRLLLVVLSIIAFGIVSCKQRKYYIRTRSHVIVLNSPETYIPQQQVAVIKRAELSLQKLAQKSSSAVMLLNFYYQNGLLAKDLGNDHFQVIKARSQPEQFFVYADLKDRRKNTGAEFHCNTHVMIIKYLPSDLTRGIYLAHEIAHAIDCANGEPPAEFYSDSWLKGERNAHKWIFNVLNEMSAGKYADLVEKSLQRRQRQLKDKINRYTIVTMGTHSKDTENILRLFGPLDNLALSTIHIQLTIDANLLGVYQYYGASPLAVDIRSIKTLRAIYRTFFQGPAPFKQ